MKTLIADTFVLIFSGVFIQLRDEQRNFTILRFKSERSITMLIVLHVVSIKYADNGIHVWILYRVVIFFVDTFFLNWIRLRFFVALQNVYNGHNVFVQNLEN